MKKLTILFYLLGFTLHLQSQESENPVLFDLKKVLDISVKENQTEEQISTLMKIGTYYLNVEHNYALSERYNQEALRVCFERNQHTNTGRILNNLSLSYRYKGDYQKSFELCSYAVRLETSRNNTAGLSLSFYNISSVLHYAGDYKKSLEYIDMTIELDKELVDSAALASDFESKALTLSDMGKTKEAIEYLTITGNYHKSVGDSIGMARTFTNIGYIKHAENKYREAIENFKIALTYCKNDLRGLAILNNNLADQYFNIGQLDSAQFYIEQGLPIALKLGKKPTIRDLYELAAKISEAKGDYKKALAFTHQFIALKDTILNTESLAKIEELEATFESDKKERDLKIKEQKILLLEQRSEVSRIKIYLLVGCIIFLVIMGISIYRFQRKRQEHRHALQKKEQEIELEKRKYQNQKLEEELTYKNGELQKLAQNIIEKNDLLESLRENIKEKRDSVKLIQEIGVVMESDKHEFQQKIDNINSLFYNQIKSLFPELTENDLRLLTLIKMNMSSKEMSILLNINPTSVDVARYRLRKKLNLSKQISFTAFFEKLQVQ